MAQKHRTFLFHYAARSQCQYDINKHYIGCSSINLYSIQLCYNSLCRSDFFVFIQGPEFISDWQFISPHGVNPSKLAGLAFTACCVNLWLRTWHIAMENLVVTLDCARILFKATLQLCPIQLAWECINVIKRNGQRRNIRYAIKLLTSSVIQSLEKWSIWL